eukprot:m.458456 g.458456  ORF g.458456 m.458456 type:complete len:772 (-) comp56992_c0_seq3:126-2441(-)
MVFDAVWRTAALADIGGSILLFFMIGIYHEHFYLSQETDTFQWDDSLIDMLVLGVLRGLLSYFLVDYIVNQTQRFVQTLETPYRVARARAGVSLIVTLSALLVYSVLKLAFVAHQGPDEFPNGDLAVVFLAFSVVVNLVELGGSLYLVLKHVRELEREYVKSSASEPVAINSEANKIGTDFALNGQPVQQSSADKKRDHLVRLVRMAGPEKVLLFWGFVNLLISSGANVAGPYYFGLVIQSATNGDRSQMQTYTAYLGVIYFIASVATYFRGWLFTLAGQRYVSRLRCILFNAMLNQEIAFFDVNRTGELTNRLASDTEVIQDLVTSNLSMLARYIVQIIGSLVIMFVLSWRLTLVLLAVVPPVAIGAVWYGRKVKNLRKKFQDRLADASSTANESLGSMRTVRSFVHEERTKAHYAKDIEKSFQIGRTLSIVIGAFAGFTTFLAQAALLLVLWYGALQVLNGSLSSGLLTSFLLYSLTLAMCFAFLSSLYGDFMQAVGASVRLFDILDRVPAKEASRDGAAKPADFTPLLELRDVTFTYASRPDTAVLKGVSLVVEPGTVVALVGPSGGGKSTVVSLLERFYDPVSGRVLIGGHDLQTLDVDWVRAQMALVSQEPVLFAGTIRENIQFGKADATQAEIEEAARLANAHNFISQFDSGYDTLVGERGIRLSGGQKQRVAIARALLMNPRVLLLDEATSALDAESEYLVQQAIDNAMKDRTVVIIAHRLSTVRNANKVVVIEQGLVAEQGTHDELIAANGVYKRLVERQLTA